MNYRFQKFTTGYKAFVDQFLKVIPDHNELPYQELYKKFTQTCYGLSNFYANHLQSMGNEAQDLFTNIEPLQKAWARENDIKYTKDNWPQQIVLAQIKKFKPDVIYLQDLYFFNRSFRKDIQIEVQWPCKVIGYRAAPTKDFSIFNDLDLILSSAPHFVEKMVECGAKALYMPLAFEPLILDRIQNGSGRDIEFSFIGGLGDINGPHSLRYALIDRLLSATQIQIWSDISIQQAKVKKKFINKAIFNINRLLKVIRVPENLLEQIPIIQRGVNWQADPTQPSLYDKYPEKIFLPVFGIDYYNILNRSKVTFNHHINCAENFAGNMRLFEATGMGACLITDWKKNISDFFIPDTEIVTYRNVDECIEKVSYLIENDEIRKSIATAGKTKTLNEHSYGRRAQLLDSMIQQML